MYVKLFSDGEVGVSIRDFSRAIVKQLKLKPYLKILTAPTTKGAKMRFFNMRTGFLDKVEYEPGLYVFFRDMGNGLELIRECLYVGKTKQPFRVRIYRHQKELINHSHPKENHPAARKAREAGVKATDDIYVKVIYDYELEVVAEKIGAVYKDFDTPHLDEYVGTILNAKNNARLK